MGTKKKPAPSIYQTVVTPVPLSSNDPFVGMREGVEYFQRVFLDTLDQLVRLEQRPDPDDNDRRRLSRLQANARTVQRLLKRGGDITLAYAAFVAGQTNAQLDADLLRGVVHAGVGPIRGGKKAGGALKREREPQRKQYRVRYAHHAGLLPEATRKRLCEIVGEEFEVAWTTIATWVPNPKSTRRGRPRKS